MTLPGACRRHRPILLDLVDRGERGPRTPAALDHLAACRPCRQELTELALTIAALRRAGRTLRAAPVPARVRPPQAPPDGGWGWRVRLGSLATSAAIAAVLLTPRIELPALGPEAASAPPARPAATITWRTAERRLAATPDLPPVAAPAPAAGPATLPPRYPDGRLRPWKEVTSSDAAPREFVPD